MHDPISALFVTQRSCSLASSALPGAPVIPDSPARRRRGVAAQRRLKLRRAR